MPEEDEEMALEGRMSVYVHGFWEGQSMAIIKSC